MKPEPVAWMFPDGALYADGPDFTRHYPDAVPLYPASALQEARRAALEEAAKVCGGLRHHNWSSESDDWIAGTDHCAAAIRALIEESSDAGEQQ